MTRDLFEMQGTITAWDDFAGEIMTDDGERIHIYPKILELYGIKQTPKIGDRICFYASRRVDVIYHIESVRMIVPSTLDNDKLRQLKDLNRALRRSRNPDEVWSVDNIEHFTGSVENYDPKAGGVIVADTGERVRFDRDCLNSGGFKAPRPGDGVEFSALEINEGWQALEISALGDQGMSKRHRRLRKAVK